MDKEIKALLLPFYFGAMDETSRLAVERALLCDEEILVDFLDLKRQLEAASPIPHGPSARLWVRLRAHIHPRRKIYASVAIGLAVAASLVLITMSFFGAKTAHAPVSTSDELLFDSSHELPASSNVL